ncbi:ABC transporter permease [Catenulispora yoronensis]|uniref:ABC transporter permease n=1 Tax=Catenulispora yoronensis TaxID=450799 RepID=A0ABP5FVK2_9ACTN
MLAFTIRRLLVSIPILILSTFLVFMLVAWGADPLGDFKSKNPPPSPAQIAAREHELGLDQPLLTQYWNWIKGVLHGDFGPSVQGSAFNINEELGRRTWVTFRLVICAIIIALILAVIVGVITAVKQYSVVDYVGTLVGFFFLSLPVFWFAILLKIWATNINNSLGTNIKTLGPPGGEWGGIGSWAGFLVLPTITLALSSYATWARFQRASMLDVLNSDYMRLARAKGLSPRRVMVRHGLRTALIPMTTQVTLDVAAIMGGTVITEQIFQWQGLGTMFLNGIRTQDTNAVLAWLLISATLVIVFNLIADLLYAVLDPRIRLS